MMDVEQLRKDILIFLRDHPYTEKWTVLKTVCPDCQKTGFIILRELIEKGLVRVYYDYTEAETPNTRDVKFILGLTTDGRVLAELIA